MIGRERDDPHLLTEDIVARATVPTVSICIPSYNHAAYLAPAIESALGQTYRDLEVVVVDDGSTDDSLEIARAYERREPERVRVFTHPGHENRGIGDTANLAREHSRGSMWSGLASDDLLHPDRLERLIAELARHPELELVYSYARYVDEAGRPLPERGLFGTDITRERHPVDLLIPGNLIPGTSVLMRRDCFTRIGFYEERLVYSDWELWVRAFASLRAGFVPKVLVDYRVHGANASADVEPSVHLPRCLEVIETLARKAPAISGLHRPRARALLSLEHAYLEFCAGRLTTAEGHLVAALEHEPGLMESPAPLAYFLTRWEGDVLHARMPVGSYAQLAGWLRHASRNPIGAALPGRAPGNFSLWVLSALPRPPTERSAREWLLLVAAVQYVAASQQDWRAGSRVSAAIRRGQALRTYPRLVSGRGPHTLLRRALEPLTGSLIGLRRGRVDTAGTPRHPTGR
jgi:GT2 family glycosyltransferase